MGRSATIALAVAAAALVIALLAARSCAREAAPTPETPAAAASAPARGTPSPARRAAPVVDTAPDAPARAAESAPAPVFPPEFRHPAPVVVAVTCGGRPVPKCDFAVARPTGDPRRVGSMSVGDDGTYRLGVDEDVDFPATVVVRAPGWEETTVEVPARESRVEVRLPEGGRVTGVVRLAGGGPVGGAHVVLAGRVATADAEGRFALADVAVGRHDHALVSTALFARSVACDVAIERPGDTGDVALVVDETVTLRVRVVRASDGVPIVGVTVEADGWSDGAPSRARAETDASGLAEVRGLSDGDHRLAAFGDEIEAVFDARVQVPHDDVIELRAKPYALRRFSGRVVDERGKGLAGMTVSLYTAHVANEHRVTTGADGSFAITGIRAFSWKGRHTATAYPSEILCVSIWPKDPTDGLTLFVPPTEGQTFVWAPKTLLTFALIEPTGAPLPDVHLQFRTAAGAMISRDWKSDGARASRRIDWSGRFAAPGTLEIQLADGRRVEREVAALTGAHTFLGDVTLDAVGRIRLHVTPPLPEGVVTLARREDDGSLVRLGWCGAQSHWLSGAIRAGRQRLVASAPGRLSVEIGDVEVVANETTNAAVVLPHPADAAVFVRRGGRPVLGARVEAEILDPPPGAMDLRRAVHVGFDGTDDDPALALAASTDAAGRVLFRRLPPGRARFHVRAADGTEATVEVTLADGGRETVDVDL